jgi:NTE family protein
MKRRASNAVTKPTRAASSSKASKASKATKTSKTGQAAAAPSASDAEDSKITNLALQGGGSHGAYTWGVLDALLEDGRLGFEGVTGASAGAMNAVVMADGWLDGLAARRDPRDEARGSLRRFWESIGRQSSVFSLNGAWVGMAPSLVNNPVFLWTDLVSRVFSPYQLNPFNYNPLRGLLDASIDFKRLQVRCPFKLFICATNVRTGRPRVFREGELELDMLLASACLPFAFQAVHVKNEQEDDFFWDGGYMGNPALWPLFTPPAAATCCWCRSTRCGVMRFRRARRRSPNASTRLASTPRCCTSCGRSTSCSACWPRTSLSAPGRPAWSQW